METPKCTDSDGTYKRAINGIKALPYSELVEDFMVNPKHHFYHYVGSVDDFYTLLSIREEVKLYCWCRCHKPIPNTELFEHEHVHALLMTIGKSQESLKKKYARRTNEKLFFDSRFKKVHCFDHIIGIMRYIHCKDGQKVGRRNQDGLATVPHLHYSRHVYEPHLLHDIRGKHCVDTRDHIEKSCEIEFPLEFLNKLLGDKYENGLHDYINCACDRSERAKKKRSLLLERRRAFYKTQKGEEIKKGYKEKKEIFDKLKALVHQLVPKDPNAANLKHKSIKNMLDTLQLDSFDVIGVSEDAINRALEPRTRNNYMEECI